MSEINEEQVRDVFRLVANVNVRRLLHSMDNDLAYSYTELLRFVVNRDDEELHKSTGLLGHYVRSLMKLKIILKDEKERMYYLSSRGVETLKLVKSFENWYSTYDMNDVNEEGQIEKFSMIVRRVKKSRRLHNAMR